MISIMAEIQSIRYRHEAIARWLLANPHRLLRECAQELGFTQAWLSSVINSDTFRVYMRQLSKEADSLVIYDIPAKLRGLASMSIDALTEQMEATLAAGVTAGDREFVKSTAEMALHKLGYAPQSRVQPSGTTNIQNNVFMVDAEALRDARQRIFEPAEGRGAVHAETSFPTEGRGAPTMSLPDFSTTTGATHEERETEIPNAQAREKALLSQMMAPGPFSVTEVGR